MRAQLLGALLLLVACHQEDTPAPPVDMTPAYPRTMITGTLQATSPQNLLINPFSGEDGRSMDGEFAAFYDDNSTASLNRTLRSVSPAGGSAAIEELVDLDQTGAHSNVFVLGGFRGGAGNFSAKIWISFGDTNAEAVPFAQAEASLSVALVDEAQPDSGVELALAVTGPVKYGDREWMLFTSTGSIAMPNGGWLFITLGDLTHTMQLAAPEVTSTALGGMALRSQAVRRPLSPGERAVIAGAKRRPLGNQNHRRSGSMARSARVQ